VADLQIGAFLLDFRSGGLPVIFRTLVVVGVLGVLVEKCASVAGGWTPLAVGVSGAQDEGFTRAVDAAEALFLGKGQQLTGTLRCLSLQGVGIVAF
jgi:hypothetical protein